MWDGASNHLDVQALAPITHPGEMNESIGNIIEKLRLKYGYATLFSNAYGDNEITSMRILKALTAFQLTLISRKCKVRSCAKRRRTIYCARIFRV